MMRTNYHTHTYRCGHATGTEEDYVKSAIKNNLSILGISDHAPFPEDIIVHSRMSYSQLNDYISTCIELKEKYKNQIELKVGFEIEYIESQHEYYKKLLNELNVEYLVLGQHFFNINEKVINTFDLNNSAECIYYAKTIEKALETGFFKILAHPDVIFINNIKFDDNAKKACEIIINAAKKYDIPLEFNANGIRRGLVNYDGTIRYPYPFIDFWKMVSKENLKVIISSDCHAPEFMWDENMENAYALANKLNLNIINEI